MFASPTKYGITKVYDKTKDDLTLDYEFTINKGMHREEVLRLGKSFYNVMNIVFPFYLMPPGGHFNAHTLLYGSKYELKKFFIRNK